jgi:hypothetical protein
VPEHSLVKEFLVQQTVAVVLVAVPVVVVLEDIFLV